MESLFLVVQELTGSHRRYWTLRQERSGRVRRQMILIFVSEYLTASFQQRMDFFDPGLCDVGIGIHQISHHGKFRCVGSLHPRTAIL